MFAGHGPGGVGVRVDGDGAAHRIRADLVASPPITVTGVDVDPDDALTAGTRAANLTGNVGAWWDGFDARVPAGATVALHVDEQGTEPVHLLNPAPGAGDLGRPRAAHRPLGPALSR